MSDWGLGTLNNSVFWGQGFINSIDWGVVYESSWAGDTAIGYTPNAVIFRDRVLADGGTIESLKCIKI
jgi:hypothetical protein